jgi:hypothetical protein
VLGSQPQPEELLQSLVFEPKFLLLYIGGYQLARYLKASSNGRSVVIAPVSLSRHRSSGPPGAHNHAVKKS